HDSVDAALLPTAVSPPPPPPRALPPFLPRARRLILAPETRLELVDFRDGHGDALLLPHADFRAGNIYCAERDEASLSELLAAQDDGAEAAVARGVARELYRPSSVHVLRTCSGRPGTVVGAVPGADGDHCADDDDDDGGSGVVAQGGGG